MATRKNQPTKAPVPKPRKGKVSVTELEIEGRYATRNYVGINERAFFAKQLRENGGSRERYWYWYALKPDGELFENGYCDNKRDLIKEDARVGAFLYPQA